jgi:uncharacterized delta-60 repeat protein
VVCGDHIAAGGRVKTGAFGLARIRPGAPHVGPPEETTTMRRHALGPLSTLALLGILHGPALAARPGDPDPAFADAGTLRVAMSRGALDDVLALPDGSLVVGGTGDPDGDGKTDFVVARVDASGALDPGFGRDGVAVTRIPVADAAGVRRLARDADGRIVAAGIARTLLGTGETSSLLKMTRYFPDGVLDRDFGDGGIRSSVLAEDVAGIAVTGDRSIVFAGRDDTLIAGSLPVGSGFGLFILPEPSAGADLVPHLGGFVIGGTAGDGFLLMRSDAQLAPDVEFGDGGTVRTSVPGLPMQLRKLLVLPDGGLIAIGAARVLPGDVDVALVRYGADGQVVATFGDGGLVVTPIGPRQDNVLDAILAPDGTMLIGGRTCSPAPPCQGFVARLRPDGSLDPDFGEDGVVRLDGFVDGLAMPDDGHVVAVTHETDALVVSRLVVATCGNGRLEAGEECDGGNTAPGGCCSPTCTFEPDDTACDGDGSACTVDRCRAGACTHVVPAEAGCFAATSSALVRRPDDVEGDRLRWSWQSTAAVEATSFRDPTDATDLTVCLLAGAGDADRPLLELAVPAAGACGGVPCWKTTRRGFRYRDAAGAHDGVTRLRLAAGAGGARIDLKAKGLRDVPELPAPVRVRVVRGDGERCFEADLAPARGSALRLESR